jgi:hypothetical protein
LAQYGISYAGLRERVEHRRRSNRPLEYRLIGEDQQPFDLPLDFRGHLQWQIRAHSARRGGAAEQCGASEGE